MAESVGKRKERKSKIFEPEGEKKVCFKEREQEEPGRILKMDSQRSEPRRFPAL